MTVPTASLVIDSENARRIAGLGSGPGAGDVRKIQQRMLSPEVMNAERFPHVQFATTSVAVRGGSELRVVGAFEMHGQSREVEFPVRYTRTDNGGYRFSGQFTVKQSDFGIEPESVGLGTVHVKDEVQIRFRVSMVPAP